MVIIKEETREDNKLGIEDVGKYIYMFYNMFLNYFACYTKKCTESHDQMHPVNNKNMKN